nr:C40 family peptidase [Cellulomonas sp. APG4]
MFSADGFEDLVQRSQAVDRLGTQADRAVQRFSAADLVASTLADLAEAAADEADAAARTAEEQLAEAEAAKDDAEQEVADATARREALVVQLADLRQTSVEVERARQESLDEERRARQEAAAAGERDAPTGGSGGTGSGGVGSGGSGSGGSSDPATPPATTTPPPTTPTTPPPTTAPPTTPPPTTPPPTTPPADRYGLGTGSARGSAAQGQAAVAWALQQVGKPYGWGASGPSAFDCSGLTSQAWRAAGLSLTRTSRSQFVEVRKIRFGDMRPGDLIFYGTNTADPQSIHHVAMYVGGGQMVEAPRPGVNVRVTAVRWSGTMLYAGRP